MDRVFLKPTPQEVVIKGNSKDGHTDVFAYNYYNEDDRRKLGGLYVVGNIKQDKDAAVDTVEQQDDAPDIAYITNLVASLAKREYYSKPDASPREAFSAALKKINDVVEEFFKNKSLKLNIGIFAIAGEQILISKLGKFKIILGRDSRSIDILNNIDLFSKDTAEEKEFSGIVSGKIMPKDKLFAFYPNRMVSAREKIIKADLLKFDGDQFIEKLNSIKETRPDFDCGALYLSLDNYKEAANEKKVKSPAGIRPVSLPSNPVRTAGAERSKEKISSWEDIRPDKVLPEEKTVLNEEVPMIISTEFSFAKKVNPFLKSMLVPVRMAKDRYFSWRSNDSGSGLPRNINLKRKLIVLSLVTGMLISGVFIIKTFIIIDPEQRQLNAAISKTKNDLKLVRTKISQNDFIGARQLLIGSLSNIYAIGIKNDRSNQITDELYGVLDNMDKAVEVSPSPLETLPEGLNEKKPDLSRYGITSPLAFDIYEKNLYVLTANNILKVTDINQTAKKEATQWLKSGLISQPTMIAVDGNIYVMNGSGILAVYYKGDKVSETNTFLISNDGGVLLTSKNSDKLYLVNKTLARIHELDKKSGTLIQTLKVDSSEPFVDAYLYGDDTIIITTKDGRIWKIK